jgi:hypothetical protein
MIGIIEKLLEIYFKYRMIWSMEYIGLRSVITQKVYNSFITVYFPIYFLTLDILFFYGG